MSQIDDAIREHIRLCSENLPKIYVSWVWVVGVAVILLGAIGGTAWALSRGQAKAEFAIQDNTNRLDKLETTIQKLNDIADDIKTIKQQTANHGMQFRRPANER
jgi:hypothetical protein